ncbi:MAG: 3-isopropylmalate dehydrogenase [Actinomycetota bacterium]
MSRRSRRTHTVVCLARHGIGPEMMAEASRALTAVSLQHGFHVDEHHVPFGADALTRFGRSFPLSSRSALLGADAVLVAAKSDAALTALEADLDLRTSISRVRFEGRAELSILAPLGADAWEWTLERAFRLACGSRGRISLVGVDESWKSEAARLELQHDGLEIERLTPHDAIRALIFTPERFDVVVCPPELSRTAVEVAASLADGRTVAWGRLAPTAPSIFGPAHGAADTLAGQGVADPSSMLLAAALMLAEGLGERSGAATLSGAVGLAGGDDARRPSTRGHADLVLSHLPVTAANAEFYREAACG